MAVLTTFMGVAVAARTSTEVGVAGSGWNSVMVGGTIVGRLTLEVAVAAALVGVLLPQPTSENIAKPRIKNFTKNQHRCCKRSLLSIDSPLVVR